MTKSLTRSQRDFKRKYKGVPIWNTKRLIWVMRSRKHGLIEAKSLSEIEDTIIHGSYLARVIRQAKMVLRGRKVQWT